MDGQRARRGSPSASLSADRRLTHVWAAALGLGWPLATMAILALEPAPADPEAAAPFLVQAASLGFVVALLITAVAAGVRHPFAAVAGVAAGLIAVGFTIGCPVSGHHTLGAWWFG